MNTIAHDTRAGRRYSLAEQAFIEHQKALLAYLANRLPVTDWHTADVLAQETWTRALSAPGRSHADDTDVDGVPGWIAFQARIVLRRYLSPVPAGDAAWGQLTQILGRSSEWPEHWHRVLVDEGQAALLRLAVREIAPTPAAVFGRPAVSTPIAVAA
ncbi:hypothetical protein AB0B12_37895 [Streptomyces sp. NPDC044780]|uniref:hypothetical protein n=1 Tax=unclassified Streptomyces TaxID=2593676 RepID=UPI0033D362AF